MGKLTTTVLFFIIFGCSCSTKMAYRSDLGFLVSAVADSPELPVMIDQYSCVDISGRQGLCSLRIKQHRDLRFDLHARNYPYRLHLVCSKKVGYDQSFDVDAERGLQFKIPYKKYEKLGSFTCIGELFPRDRPDKVSAKFEVRVKVIQAQYVEREKMRLEKDGDNYFLIVGQHALYSRVYDQGKWSSYREKVQIEVFDTSTLSAISESYSFRVNSYP